MNRTSLIRNTSGFVVAAVVAGIIFGQTLETTFFPVLTDVRIYDITRQGRELYWSRDFCKARNLHIDSVSFQFSYAKQRHAGLPVNVINESLGKPVGALSYAPGCFTIRYSAMIPADALPGDQITGQLWYNSSQPFWLLPQEFGPVVVPGPTP